MKLLIISEVSGLHINNELNQIIKNLSTQSIEVTYYNPRQSSCIPDSMKPFAASMIMTDLSDKILMADYIILDSRLSPEFYQIALGMLYGNELDRVYVFGNDSDYSELRTSLLNRKSNEPFESTAILVDTVATPNSTVSYDEVFYRLVGSKVSRVTFTQDTYSRLITDRKMLGLLWHVGEIKVIADINTTDPYLLALLDRC